MGVILIITDMDINELFFLGTNKYGQAGIGEKHHNKTFQIPKSFAFEIFVKQISCGAHHSALLTIDGHVYTMGSNIHGALGASPNLNYSFVPTLVEGLEEVSRIDCGPFHMCAVDKGALYSWGKGIDGQLGHGNTKNMQKPTLIESLQGEVEAVSCGTNHTIVSLRKDVHLCPMQNKSCCYAFGNGIYGQLGTGQSRNSYIPARVRLDNHSLFVVDGRVYACGDNSSGQLGTLLTKKFASEPTR
jgi:alpha-tubulin suppressor-like RCC1 family protein